MVLGLRQVSVVDHYVRGAYLDINRSPGRKQPITSQASVVSNHNQEKIMKKILISGATGAVGKNAIKKLLELKVTVRALVHKADARSEQLSAQGVEIVEGDLSDFDSVSTALKGVTGAYYMYPIQVPGILEGTAIFAQAAIEEGVGFIVNMSQIAARKVAKSHASQDHWIAELLMIRY